MIAKVGPKGQIVIPKELRDELGIRPGTTVALRLRAEAGTVEVRRAWDDPISEGPAYIRSLMSSDARGRFGTQDLLAMRREDKEIEERQYQRWRGRSSSSTRNRS